MARIIQTIKKWFTEICLHEWEIMSIFDKKMQNNYLRPVICENQRCVKCGGTRVQDYWTDLYIFPEDRIKLNR